MKVIDNILEKLSTMVSDKIQESTLEDSYYYQTYQPTVPIPFDGEKTPGELGRPVRYYPHYYNLRVRSWESYLNNEIPQIVINKYVLWVVGKGLKLQAEPKTDLLPGEFNSEEFKTSVETRFRLYADDKLSTWSETMTLNQLACEAVKNAKVGGDVLLIIRIDDNIIKSELIDGAHVETPITGGYAKQAREKRNRIIYGVEIDDRGRHIAYYVRNKKGGHDRIPARGEESGRLVSTMIYGLKYRLNETRGIPLMTAVAETIKKLDRYKEAAVGSAEERAKIVFIQTHDLNAMGKSVLRGKPTSNARNVNDGKAPEQYPYSDAQTIATTTQKQTFNVEPGSDVKALQSDNELNFESFFNPNRNLIAATVGIPPAVAFDDYDKAFNSAQAGVKSWGHKLDVEQNNFGIDFYQPIYDTWLEYNDLIGVINIPGFQTAIKKDRNMYLAYKNARWIGPLVPQIDPLKEVKAEVEKLNNNLTTHEAAAERLNLGDWNKNIEQYTQEKEKLPVEVEQNNNQNGEED